MDDRITVLRILLDRLISLRIAVKSRVPDRVRSELDEITDHCERYNFDTLTVLCRGFRSYLDLDAWSELDDLCLDMLFAYVALYDTCVIPLEDYR